MEGGGPISLLVSRFQVKMMVPKGRSLKSGLAILGPFRTSVWKAKTLFPLLLNCEAEGSKAHAVCHSTALTMYRGSLVKTQGGGLGTAASETLALGRKCSFARSVKASSLEG